MADEQPAGEQPPAASEEAEGSQPAAVDGAERPEDTAPPPAKAAAEKPDVGKIIEDSLELGASTRMFAYEQKCNVAMMTFLLNRVFETMVMYQEYVCHLNRFLVNNDAIQYEWYTEMCCNMPSFGDYSLVLEDKPEPIAQETLASPVAEGEVLAFTRDVGDNYFASGSLIGSLRALCTNIDARVVDRREIQCELVEKQPSWFYLLDDAIEQLESLSNWSLNTSGYVEMFGLD